MSKNKKLTVWVAVSLAMVGLVLFIKSQYLVPVIMYHSVRPVAPANNAITVSADIFEKQMSFLKRNRYNVVSLESLAGYFTTGAAVPAKTIAITFDDGYEDNYTYVFPILKKYNFPASIFLIFSEAGKPDRLSWKEIKEMQDSGLVSFGSHTLTHCFLPQVGSDQVLKNEVFGSKKELENRLGKTVDTFCYPMGRFDSRVEKVVKDSGYKLAVVTNPGKNFSSRDILAIKRLRISENSGNMFVFWIETTGYYNFIREIRQHNKR